MERTHQISEVKTDVRLLLECLKCQIDNPTAMKQAFRTLATIFTNIASDDIKDYFRDQGGLDFIRTFNKDVTHIEVKESALYCLGCAVEDNVYSQKELTTGDQFAHIHKILSDERSTARLKHAASYLLLTLVSKNSIGQNLAKKSLCLSDLLTLLRTSLPSSSTQDCWFDDAGATGVELWSSVASTLCMCVNNPQNEENQRVCGFVLPYVLSVVQNHEDSVIRPLLSFIRFTVANNESNQKQVQRCGGLAVLSDKLTKCSEKPNLAIPIISTLDACISDNVENAEEIGKLGTVRIMMALLNSDDIIQAQKLQIVLTLVHAVEMSEKNKNQILEESGIYSLMKSLNDVESGDDELFKAVKYLLQLCTKQDTPEEDNSEANEMLDILKKTEEMHRKSGQLLLNKINELSERLDQFEDESARQLQSPVSFMSECSNYNQGNPQDINRTINSRNMIDQQLKFRNPHETDYNATPIKSIGYSTERFTHAQKDIPRYYSYVDHTPRRNFRHDNYLQDCNENLHLNNNVQIRNSLEYPNEYNTDSNRNKSIPPTNDCNSNVKKAYYNEVELNRINPTIPLDNMQSCDYSQYLGNNSLNASFRMPGSSNKKSNFYRRDSDAEVERLYYSGKDEINEKGDSFSAEGTKGSLTKIFDYHHGHLQRRENSQIQSDLNIIDERGQKLCNDGRNGTENCLQENYVDEGHNDLNSLDQKMNIAWSCKKEDTSYHNNIEDTSGRNIEGGRLVDNNNNFISNISQSFDLKDVRNEENNPDSKTSKNFAQKDIQNDSEDEDDSVFLHGEQETLKPKTKPKKYEIKLVEMTHTNESPDKVHINSDNDCIASEIKSIYNTGNRGSLREKQNGSENKSETKSTESTETLNGDMPNFMEDLSRMEVTNQESLDKEEGSKTGDINSKSPTCVNEESKTVHKQIEDSLTKSQSRIKCHSFCTPEVKSSSNSFQNNKSTDGNKNEISVKSIGSVPFKNPLSNHKRCTAEKICPDSSFKKPTGLPPKSKTSVRRAQPYWKRTYGPNYLSDSDCMSSGDEGSLFDEALVRTARLQGPCSDGEKDFLPLTPIHRHVKGTSMSRTPLLPIKPCTVSSVCSSPVSDVHSEYSTTSTDSKDNMCKGCTDIRLNSRTFNLVIESNPYTCGHHRAIRELERQFIKEQPTTGTRQRKPVKALATPGNSAGTDVYEFSSDSEGDEISPPEQSGFFTLHLKKDRRKREAFSEEEKKNLLLGVERYGKSWSLILNNFNFHPCRTTVDLKDKYRGLQKQSRDTETRKVNRGRPFSMCEDRRLLRGVTQHGYNWKMILKQFTFSKQRTSEDLRNRWRTLHKKPSS